MKKALAFILSLALIMSALVFPTATLVSAETDSVEAELSFSGTSTVYNSGSAIRTKVLKDGTVAAVYYKGGIYYATSTDGGITFKNDVQLIENATDSELAKSEEVTTQTTLAKEYVEKYGEFGRGRLEAQNPNLIELDNGNIMVFYRYNTYTTEPDNKPWSIYYASICYQILDKETGKWSDVQVMVETEREKELNDSADYGFWEPDPVYITDQNGNTNLFVYYADTATPEKLSYQHIMYTVWDEENDTFSTPEIAQNGIDHTSRDGMSVVTKLSDGNYAMVFESTNTTFQDTTFVIKMSLSKDGKIWTAPVIVAKPDKAIDSPTEANEFAVCASPYIVTLPDGKVAISYQTTDRYTGETPNRVSYRVGSQIAISNTAITYNTYDGKKINTDVTADFPEVAEGPGELGENEFSKSASLLCVGNYLMVYYNEGENIFGDNDSVTNDIGALMGSYMKLPVETEATDYTDLDNYVVYQANTGTVPSSADGKITVAAGGTTNLIAGTEKYEYKTNDVKLDGIFDSANYTEYNTSEAARVSFAEDTSTVTVSGVSKAYYNKDTELTTYKVSSVLESTYTKSGARTGYMQSGYIIHASTKDFTDSAFNSSGYVIFLRRNANASKLELIMRYCNGSTAVTYQTTTLTSSLESAKADYKFRLDVEVTEDNAIISVYDVTGETPVQLGSTKTWALDYTSKEAEAPVYDSGAFAFVTNGATTYSDFNITETVTTKVDKSVYEQATNLKAHGVFTMNSEVPAGSIYAGFSFHVQQAAAVTAGLTGYTVKLLQTKDDLLKLEFSVYQLNEDKTKCTNLKSYAVDVTEYVIGTGDTTARAKIVLDVTVIDDKVTATVTNSANTSLTTTKEYDLNNYYQYAEYGQGGYGIYKHGTGTIAVEDVEFTPLNVDVNTIDESLYTLYAPEGSTGLTVEDKAFVSTEAVTQKAMVTDVNVHNFNADAVFEIGNDGNLKAGIVFRAQNIGNGTNDMEGYSVVLYKTPSDSNNSRIVASLYKWGRDADGNIVYLGEVGRLDADTTTLASVYPDTKNMLLASAGIKLKLNLAVVNDKVTFSFDVLNELNDVAASSASKTVDLSSKTFTKEANATVYNAGAIGLSISSKGKICDFNYTAEEGYEISDIKGYKTYSNDENSLVLDSTNNKIYSTTKNFKQAVLTGSNVSEFTASATLKSTTAGVYYNMGFDFMIKEATHSGYAYNNSHVSYGYEGYRLVLVRNANDSDNPAGTTLYLFQFAKNDDGSYTRTQLKSVPHSTFFSDYTTEDTTDAEYASVEVDLEVAVDNGVVTATATMCEHTDKVITLTYDGVEGSGAVGWYIAQGGSINNLSVKEDIADTLISAADCVNGSVHAATNAGGTASGDEVKIVTIPAEGYCVHDVYTTVNGVNTDIEKSENGFVFAKKGGATEISATFFKFGDIDEDGNVNGSDIVCLRKELLKLEDYKDTYTDVNGDEAVNIKDLVRIKKIAVEITE